MKVVSVDLQQDFSREGSICYFPRPCVPFLINTFLPFVKEKKLKIAEIISDYRLPRPLGNFESCIPGTQGYESEIEDDLKYSEIWVKSMNSPVWIRANSGNSNKKPGAPYPDPKAFDGWLSRTIGTPTLEDEVILIGLTLDCCVLCTAKELSFRGYSVRYLVEGVDCYSGNQDEKQMLFKSAAGNWGKAISWEEFKRIACI